MMVIWLLSQSCYSCGTFFLSLFGFKTALQLAMDTIPGYHPHPNPEPIAAAKLQIAHSKYLML
jgi:hypothetical protein